MVAMAMEAKAMEAKAIEDEAMEVNAMELKAMEAKAIEAKAMEAKAMKGDGGGGDGVEGEDDGCCSDDGDDGDGDGGGGDYVFFIGAARRSGPHVRLQPSPRRLCQRARASTPHGRARSVAEQRRTVQSPVQQPQPPREPRWSRAVVPSR